MLGATVTAPRRLPVPPLPGKYRMAAVTDEGDSYMWEGRSDFFPAEGRQAGSGSKKHGTPRTRAIPGMRGGTPDGSVGRSGSVEAGSFGSFSRKGSFFERYAREREAGGAPGSYGAPDTPSSATKQQYGSDAFTPIVPAR